MSGPNPQDPLSPLYDFIDEQPADEYPITPDSSLSHFTYRQFTPDNITNALPCVVTKTAHGLSNGQAIRALKFSSSTGMIQLNNTLTYVQFATTDTFILADAQSVPIDARSFTTYVSGGQFTVTGPILVVNPSHFPPAGVVTPVF